MLLYKMKHKRWRGNNSIMIRTIIWFAFFWIYLLFTLPALMKVKKLDKQNRIKERDDLVFKTARNWARALVNLTGTKINIIGAENIPKNEAVVFVSNHQGNFDIPILLGFLNKPKAFIAKKELIKFPIISTWMKYMNCVFMDRKDIRQSLQSINQGIEYIKEGYSMVIFPEGTRSIDGQLKDFKPGSLRLALKSGAPIVPVTIKGSINIMGKNSYIIKPANVTVIVSSPIDPITIKDTNKLTEMIRDIIKGNLE